MQIKPSAGCCGLYEIYDLAPLSANTLIEFIELYEDEYAQRGRLAFAFFSDNNVSGRGFRLSKYITRKKLGKIVATEERLNTKSNNNLTCWMWSIDWEALERWRDNF